VSKAVLVMDMPENCDKCCVRAAALAWCMAAKKSTSHHQNGKAMDERKRPDWCPLVAVPDKLPYSDTKGIAMASYIEGWNDCIKKLSGDENG